MLERRILINRTAGETRIAVVEDGRLAEIEIDRRQHRTLTGNIYKGRVQRVLPGMQAAFIEIGLERTAFLPVGRDDAGTGPIETRICAGDDVVVQVTKEPVASKGARLTSAISLPGRFAVYLPGGSGRAVSRRIDDPVEQQRIAGILDDAPLPAGGWIARTSANGVEADTILGDTKELARTWGEISQRATAAAPPQLLFTDADPALRAVRDLADQSLHSIVTDAPEVAAGIEAILGAAAGGPRVSIHSEAVPLFTKAGIETAIEHALRPKVRLPSGGFLVIERTEALTVIDVNTGSYTGDNDQQATALTTNLEAATAIARELRLRNLGGMMLVDFIDIEEPEARDQVCGALRDELARQRCITDVSPFSGLGLVEFTRRRNRQPLADALRGPCPVCRQSAGGPSPAAATYALLRELRKRFLDLPGSEGDSLEVQLADDVAAYLAEHEPDGLQWAVDGATGRVQCETTGLPPGTYSVA